jgi:DHA1 family bicyclomycin/chloramphenicol resistance-like MFS transporter
MSGSSRPETGAKGQPSPGFGEFVFLIALAMAMTSLSIDNVLPAFDPIAVDLGVANPTRLQMLVFAYMAGFAIMQVIYGPVADAFGRKPVLMFGFGLYAVGCVVAIAAPTFEVLILARLIQGLGAAAGRVLTLTIVRDRFGGHEMARVMSLVMMVFLIVPVFAPATGLFFLHLGGWRLIFVSMLGLVAVVTVAYLLRMPETLKPEHKMPFSPKRIANAARIVLETRATLGYALCVGLMFGALMVYIALSQPIFETVVYGLGPLFPAVFGAMAGGMACASVVSSMMVRRLGMRRLCHVGTVGYVVAAAVLVAVALLYDGKPPLILFSVNLGVLLALFALTMPSLNALAMEPLGAVAGTASSLIGSFTTVVGITVGALFGGHFDGTVMPLAYGFLICGAAALVVMLLTERGRMFAGRRTTRR